MATPLGTAKKSSLFNRICESDVFNLDILFFPFSIYEYYIFLLVYDIFVILNLRVENMFFVWIFFAGGGLGLHFSPFTHLPYILYMT